MGLFFVIYTQTLHAQAFIVNISNGLKEGKAETIATYFDNTIDLSFSDVTNTYSKKQAEVVLQRFLSKIEPKSYLNNQKGNSAYNNSKFCIGTLSTSNGNYKVYMFFILRKDTYFLKELRFEK